MTELTKNDLIKILETDGLKACLSKMDLEPALRMDRIRLGEVFAHRVQHLMTDPRSGESLDVAERFAGGLATEKELEEAKRAARAAEKALVAGLWAAAGASTWAAEAARSAAAEGMETGVAAWAAGQPGGTEHAAQTEIVRQYLTTGKIGEKK